MIINLHNYEEYFILYIDNELSVGDRRLVDEFVMKYPDLKDELDQLMQYKVQPDTSLEFPAKEELWKGRTLIHSGNQSNWLMLLLDGELSAGETALVEEYLREEPAARKEWELLQKTKLNPPTVIFENKESLYQREEKRRLIPVFFSRIAAAIILVAIGLGIFFIYTKNAMDKETSLAGNNKITPAADSTQIKNNREAEIPTVIARSDKPVTEEKKQPGIVATFQKDKASVNKVRDEKPISFEKESIALNKEKEKEKRPSNNLPLPVNNPRISIDEKAMAYSKPEEEIHNNGKNNSINNVTNPAISPSDIKTAAFDPNEELEDQNGKKNKHRGIFRTIARTFEKRTKVDPTEDDKLLVAGFRISLK